MPPLFGEYTYAIYIYIIYIYIYPVRCAHNPPPCHFFANCKLSIPVCNTFFKTCCQEVLKTILLEVRIMIFWFGTLQAAPSAHFYDFEDCCDFGGALATKKPFHFEVKMQLVTHFFSVEFCMFFVSVRFSSFVVILAAWGIISGFLSGVLCEPWAFEKTVKSV